MNTISEIRLANARKIADEYTNSADFAKKIDRESTQVSRFMGANPTKKIGEKMARHIEIACGRPKGWLDTIHSPEPPSSTLALNHKGLLNLDLLNKSYDQQIKNMIDDRNHAAKNGWYEKAANFDIQIEAFNKARRIANSGDFHI